MLEHFYTIEEIKEIRANFHRTLTFRSQFEKIQIDEDESIKNFLMGNFKVGSLEDPLLDCFGTAVFKYKFKQSVPKRMTNMSTVNNLPHIMDATVVDTHSPKSNEVSLDGGSCTINYQAVPSSKKPGKAIVKVSIAYGEEEISFKYYTKSENASEEVLAKNFAVLKKACDSLFNFNVALEEAEDDKSKKGVFNVRFEPKEVDTYGQYYEIEPVEEEVNFANAESVIDFVKKVYDAVEEYNQMLNELEEGKTKVITITKGGKNDIEYLSNESPVICGNLIKLEGNFTSEETFVSSLDVKVISEHTLTEDDISEMASVICSDLGEEDEVAEDESPVEMAPADEAETEVENP